MLFLHLAPIFVNYSFVNIPSSNYPNLSVLSVSSWDPDGRMWFEVEVKWFSTELPTQTLPYNIFPMEANSFLAEEDFFFLRTGHIKSIKN